MNLTVITWHAAQVNGIQLQTLQAAENELLAANICTEHNKAIIIDLCSRPLNEVGECRLGGFLDDIHWATMEEACATRAHALSCIWQCGTGQNFNPSKCFTFGRRPEDRVLNIGEHTIENDDCAELLGERLLQGQLQAPDGKRLEKVKKRLGRVQKLPGGQMFREKMIKAAAMSCLYDGACSYLPPDHCGAVRAAVWNAIRGCKTYDRCTSLEMSLSCFYSGHVTDPYQSQVYRSILDIARLPFLDDRTRNEMTMIWGMPRWDRKPPAPGPFSRVLAETEALGWHWPTPFKVILPGDLDFEFPLEREARAQLAHCLRNQLRQHAVSDMRSDSRRNNLPKRSDMEGIEEGIDFDRTRELWKESSQWDKGGIQAIVAGGFRGRERSWRHKRPETNSPFCVQETCSGQNIPDDRKHIFWLCPHWERLRSPEMIAARQNLQDLKPCTIMCGIFLLNCNLDAPKIQKSMLAIFQEYLDKEVSSAVDENGAPDDNEPPPDSGPDDDSPANFQPIARPGAKPKPKSKPKRKTKPKTKPKPKQGPKTFLKPKEELVKAARVRREMTEGTITQKIPHPPAQVTYTETHVTCGVCKRTAKLTDATAHNHFYIYDCVLKMPQFYDNPRELFRAKEIWQNHDQSETQKLIEKTKDHHGGSIVGSTWTPHSPIGCSTCHWYLPAKWLLETQDPARSTAYTMYRLNMPACTKDSKRADILFAQVKIFVDAYNKHMSIQERKHVWIVYDAQRLVICRTCGVWINHFWKEVASGKGKQRTTKFFLGDPLFGVIQKFLGCAEINKGDQYPMSRFQRSKLLWSNSELEWEKHIIDTITPDRAAVTVQQPNIEARPLKLVKSNKIDPRFREISKTIVKEMGRISSADFATVNNIQ